MAPGESIRGQIHLELPKATPVHSIEVCLTGTVTALDGTRLGSMKTVTFLEESKTVATASVTNARTNTARRHTTQTTAAAGDEAGRGRSRRGDTVNGNTVSQDRARSPAIPIQNTITAAAVASQGNTNSQRLNSEQMSRTLSTPSPFYASGRNTSTLSLNRSMSPTPADLRGRRASFSANVDSAVGGFGGGIGGRAGRNLSMINISTLSQFPMGELDDPSLPEAPSYDPPNYEGLFTSNSNERSSGENSGTDAAETTEGGDNTTASTERTDEANGPTTTSDQASTSEDVTSHSRRPSRESRNNQPTTETEPKAVMMQPGNYVIPFSIRIPASTVMSLPGSFSDPVGSISYQIKAVMKQILPSPDPYDPKALVVEPTFTSSSQVIKLIPMNDPTYMPLYNVPFETETVRANVGHWVFSTGFMEARAWVPKQGYRPGRVVPLVIHIVNHSDAKQVVVETTLCKCLHYGSGLSKIRAMGIAGQGYLMDPTVVPEVTDEATPVVPQSDERSRDTGRRERRRRSSIRTQSRQETSIPSPPASPYGSSFPMSPISDQSSDTSVHRARTANPSMTSISTQRESIHSNSSDGNSTPTTSGPIQFNPDGSTVVAPPTVSSPSAASASSPPPTPASALQTPLPIVQHQREKMGKSKTQVNCSHAVDREIQKTILVPIPNTTGYSILNAPLLEVSYEIVIKIRAEKMYSRNIRLSVPIVILVPEEGDIEEEEELLVNAGLASPASMARDLGVDFAGDEFDFGGQGECPPYEATASVPSHRSRR